MKTLRSFERYNELLDVRDASQLAETPQGRAVLDALLSRISEAGQERSVGIRLLHKHNDLAEGEWMIERAETDEEGYALITQAEVADAPPGRPNSWALHKEGLIDVEHSDNDLIANIEDTASREMIFKALAEVISGTQWENVFGPCMHYSAVVEARKPTETSAFLEKTDREDRANVLRYVERESIDFTASVETKWSAERTDSPDGKPIWMAKCTCFCSVSTSGGHLGTKTHRYE